MKNADLFVDGKTAGQLDIDAFTAPDQMVRWEFAAYDAYGKDRCDAENIETLADLFGQEFHDRFRAKHARLLAAARLVDARKELADLQAYITKLERQLETGIIEHEMSSIEEV